MIKNEEIQHDLDKYLSMPRPEQDIMLIKAKLMAIEEMILNDCGQDTYNTYMSLRKRHFTQLLRAKHERV